MGDREGRPYAGLVAGLFGCRGDACRRPRLSSPTLVVAHAIAPAGRAVAHAGFPMASFGSVRDATRAWDATSYEGNEAVLDSGWATARVAPTRASWPGCSGVGATLVVAHACRRPRLSSPTLVVAHACRRPRYRARRARRRPRRFPDGLVRVGTGRHLVRRKRRRAGFGMGDREGRPYAGLVAGLFGCRGDACRRPRLSSPTLVVAHACRRPRLSSPTLSRRRARRRPRRFPDGLVRVGTGRHLVRRKRRRAGFGMGDREGRPYAGLVAGLFGCRGDACRRPRLSSPTLSRP